MIFANGRSDHDVSHRDIRRFAARPGTCCRSLRGEHGDAMVLNR